MWTRPSLERLRLGVAWLLVAAAGAASAADALDLRADRERQRAANERKRIEADYTAKVKACETQFIVTSCVEQAKAERRQALDRLTQQQAVMDDALRKQRAAERLEQLQEKQQAAVARRNAPAQPPRVVRRAAQGASAASAPASAAHASPVPLPVPRHNEPMTAEERERNEAAYQQRQEAAAAHREAVEKRNAQRAAAHKPAASLPVPAVIPASGPEAPAK